LTFNRAGSAMPPDIDCTVKWMPQSAIQRYEINLPMRERKVIFATPILRYPPPGVPELRIDSTMKALSQISKVYVYSELHWPTSPPLYRKSMRNIIGH
jgi:hypothetical protein